MNIKIPVFLDKFRRKLRWRRLIRHEDLTCLMQAVILGDRKWIEEGTKEIDANETNKFGTTALHFAALKGDIDIMNLLLGLGANPNRKNNFGITPFMNAVSSGKIEAVMFLFDHKIDANCETTTGMTALMQAVMFGYKEIVEELLSKGENPEASNNVSGATPLIFATWYHHPAIAQILLAHGAKVDSFNHSGMTALMHACRENKQRIAKILLRFGANPELNDIKGRSAVSLAKEKGYSDLVKILESKNLGNKLDVPLDKEDEASDSNVEFIRQAIQKYPTNSFDLRKSSIDLVISFLAFVAIGLIFWDIQLLCILLPILLIHESGHLLAMKILGYKGLGLTFLPLAGAVATAKKETANLQHEVIVLLAGPIPGILIGLACIGIFFGTRNLLFLKFGIFFTFVNWVNLLPFSALDGGQLTQLKVHSSLQTIRQTPSAYLGLERPKRDSLGSLTK